MERLLATFLGSSKSIDDRKKKRADSQKKRRAAKKAGRNINGKDYDHYTGTFVTAHRNRGGMNPRRNGTKNE